MIRIPSDVTAAALPEPIAQALRRLLRRIRVVVLLRGISAVVATASIALLVIMGIDAKLILFADWPRYALTLTALGATVASAVWFLILPLAKTITLSGVARAIEDRHPELQERLSSAVELLMSSDMPELRGSEALIQALVQEASQDATRVRPRSEITLKTARPFLLAAAGAMLIFALIFAIDPLAAQRLLARAVAPYLNLPNVRAEMLTVEPGDWRLAEGERLEIKVTVASTAVKHADFRKMMADGSESVERMTALPPSESGFPRFTITCPPAEQSFRYRINAGEALTMYYNVTVVPPPVVKQLAMQYDFPKYARLEPLVVKDSQDGKIQAVVGTLVTVWATTNKPVKSAEVLINDRAVPDVPVEITTGPDGAPVCKFQIRLTPRLGGQWSLSITDQDGMANVSGRHPLKAVPDARPTVAIITPKLTAEKKELRLKPSDHLPVTYEMADDYGLSAAEFEVKTDSGKFKAVPIPLPAAADRPTLKVPGAAATLDLASLPLGGARKFTFRIRAIDTLPADLKGPQEGFSHELTVVLDLTAESYAMQSLQAEEEAIRKMLEKILRELKTSKEDSVPLKDTLPSAAMLNQDLMKRLDRMSKHLGVAKDTSSELVPKVAEGSFAGMAPKVNLLYTEVDTATNESGQIKVTETAPERGTLARTTDQHIDRAIAIVEELLKQLKEMTAAAELAQHLKELAERQQELAAAKAQPDQTQQNPSDWQKEENAVAKATGDIAKSDAAAVKADLAKDQAKAKDLANEVRKLEKEQRGLAQDTQHLNDLKQVDNALKALAAEQAQLAREAAANKPTADQAKPMGAAAENIQTGALEQAIEKQKGAENALAQRAAQPENPAAQPPQGQQPQGQQPQGQQPQAQQPQGQQPQSPQPQGQQPQGQQPQVQQPAAPKLTPQQAQQAQQMAQKQTQIREKTEALMAQRQQAAQQIAKSQMQRLQEQQAEVAKEASQLAKEAAPAGQEAAHESQEAAAHAEEAAKDIPANVPEAAKNAAEAGQQLQALAQNLTKQATQKPAAQPEAGQKEAGQKEAGQKEAGQKEAGQKEAGGQEAGGQHAGGDQGAPDAGQMGQMAQEAQGLAERQQEIAHELQALSASEPQKALAAEQKSIEARTADLKQETAALAQRAQAMAPQPAGQQAQQATDALTQAGQAEHQAEQTLNSPAPQNAVPSQQNAANALEAAANALAALGQTLAQAANQMSPPASPMAEPLADAFNATTEAAQEQTAAAAAEAAHAMDAAAAQAMAQAQAKGVTPGQMPGMGQLPGQQPSPSPDSKKGVNAIAASLTAAKLERMGIKLSDWARLPGELRNQILQASEEAGPEEYRTLIKRYFQQVAKRGSAETEGGK